MKNGLVELNTQPWAAEREWTADGIPVLHARGRHCPVRIRCKAACARRIDRFYRLQKPGRTCVTASVFWFPRPGRVPECPGIQRTLHPHGGGADVSGHL